MGSRLFKARFAQLASAALALSATACSPSLFFNNAKDQSVAKTPNYRKINVACSGMQLSSATLDVPTFRQLVSCLNSQGGLEPIQKLMDSLSDAEAQPLVDTLNNYIVGNPQLVYSLNRTYYTLAEQKTLDESLKQFGTILQNEDFVSAAIAVLKDKYFSRSPYLLKAFEQISTKLTPGTVADALDVGLTISTSKAFASVLPHFRGDSPAGRDLKQMAAQVIEYLHEELDPRHVNAGKEIINAILNSKLLETLDSVTGATSDEIRAKLARTSAVLKVQLADNARLLGGMASLFHYLHKGPISCMQGSEQVSDGVMFVLNELSRIDSANVSSFIKKGNLLTLTAMNPLCTYPAELSRYYPMMMDLADTSAMEPAADLMKALYGMKTVGADGTEKHPLAELFVNILSDTGSGMPGGPAEDTSGIRDLIPFLAEIADRGALDDVLLLGTQLRVEDRPKLNDALKFLMAPVPKLGGQSVYDILADAISSTSASHLYDLIWSLQGFIKSDEPILAPAMTGLRAAFYVNDVHPVIDLTHALMADASKNTALFDTLFKISEKQDFKDSVKLVSQMSKDGRLKDLIGVFVVLFDKVAQQGQFEIHPATAPAFVPRLRHNLSAADLVPFEITHADSSKDPCRKIDPNLSMSDTSNPAFIEQAENMVACLNSNGHYADLQAAVDFLASQKTQDGRSFLGFSIDLVKELGLNAGETGFVSGALMQWIDDGRMNRALEAIPMFVPVLQPVLDVIRPVVDSSLPSVQRLESFGAKVLRRDEIPSVIKYLDVLSDQQPEPVVAHDPQSYDKRRIAEWVSYKECRNDLQPRVEQIIDEYRNSITSWDLVSGSPRRGWNFSEFQANLEPTLQLLARPHATQPGKRVFDALLSPMRNFSLPSDQKPNRYQHYHPEELPKWLQERASDYRPVTYYYPGESVPRVRLMNSLDRLELVLVDADFNAPVIQTNFALKFLGEIAEAWGDEPYELWPEEIKQKYPHGKGVKTLAEVVADINSTQSNFEHLIGFPSLPDCFQQTPDAPNGDDPSGTGAVGWLPGMKDLRPGMFNLHQVLPVLQENVDNGGLRVLRDLFFEVYYSTPAENRSSTSSENHLNVVLKMARMGIFRDTGRNIRYFQQGDQALQDFFNALISGGMTPDTHNLLETLLVQDRGHTTLWKLIGEVFHTLGADGNSSDDALHFKQMMFYLTATTGQFGITDFVMQDLAAIVKQYNGLLASNSSVFGTVFKSRMISRFARALYEDQDFESKYQLASILRDTLKDPSRGLDLMAAVQSVLDDSSALNAWDRFLSRLNSLVATPEYQALNLKELVRDLVRSFEEESSDPEASRAAHRIRFYLAERMESKELDQFLILARKNPTETYRVLSTLGNEVQNGDIRRLLELARRSLSKPKH